MNPDQNDPKEEFRDLAEQLGLKLEPWQIDILKAMDSETPLRVMVNRFKTSGTPEDHERYRREVIGTWVGM